MMWGWSPMSINPCIEVDIEALILNRKKITRQVNLTTLKALLRYMHGKQIKIYFDYFALRRFSGTISLLNTMINTL